MVRKYLKSMSNVPKEPDRWCQGPGSLWEEYADAVISPYCLVHTASMVPFLHAAAPDIRWSDLQSSRLHLPQPSGCRSDGHKEFGRLSGISSKRRTLFGGINSMFPRAPEKYRLTLQMSGVWVRSRRKNSSSDNSNKNRVRPKGTGW